MAICPFCKKQVKSTASRCPYCTSQLEGDERWEASKGGEWIGALILIAIIAIVVIFPFYIKGCH
jgi:hypothetical protein